MVLSLFGTRLFQLQGLEASAYAESATRSRVDQVELPARRGAITDTHGVALATTVDARDIVADPTLIDEADKGPAATVLAELLGLDRDVVLERLSGDRRFSYVAKQVPPQTAQRVFEARLPGTDDRIPGIFPRNSTERIYPAGGVAAGLVGFVGAEGEGLGGLEYALEDQLSGIDGQMTYEFGLGGRIMPLAPSTGHESVPGRDVRLTIDRDIQWAAQQAVAKAVEETEAESGTVVVYDVKTGHLHAVATVPSFNPNDPGPRAELGSRAFTEAYEPGSTGKVMTAAALIEEGVVTPETPLTVPNRLQRGGSSFKDWESRSEPARMTYAGTIARSSNIGQILAAERLGLKKLYPYFKKFGIGQPTGLDFPGGTSGSLPEPSTWSKTTGYTLTFGQGYSVNTIQMASVFATIANGGLRVPPTLVEGFTDPDGTYHPTAEPEPVRVVSEETASQVTRMLEAVVGEGGTAPSARIEGYRVAGKTGTAQRYEPECGCYRGFTMSFIGFAPADAPRLVVAVTLQDPQSGSGGGSTGGPVFAEVMSFALQSLRVPPTGAEPPTVPLTWDR